MKLKIVNQIIHVGVRTMKTKKGYFEGQNYYYYLS